MDYLTSNYWDKFKYYTTYDKGITFENLIKDLLIAEYGKFSFQNTKHSWDGNRDFYYYSEQKNFWAECKNYNSNVDLKVLSATLIMAQLSEIDTILFYSYSYINLNTKAKLLANAERNSKTVYFYDDVVLERKIFQFWNHIGEFYFPEFPIETVENIKTENSYEAKCILFGNPLDLGASIDEYELKHLTLFKVFEMNICIINKDLICKNLSIEFKRRGQIKAQFEVYPEHIIKSKMNVTLLPYEGKIIKIMFIPIKENCNIPRPYINGNRLNLPSNIEFKSLKIENKNIRRLIGKNYEQCVIDFKQKVLFETNKFRVGILYGNSGTGKSRLYQEFLNFAKINNYEIIDFYCMPNIGENVTMQDFIKTILIVIYNLSMEGLEELIKSIKIYENSKSFISNNIEFSMLVDIFKMTDQITFNQWLSKYFELFVIKLTKSKLLIAIDNIQFIDEKILDFVDKIYIQLMNMKSCNTKFLFVFNVDYIERNSKTDIMLCNYTANHCVTYAKHISGFEDVEECFEFLQELFSITDILNKQEIDKISENLNKNPFYLEQMIYWLHDNQVLKQKDNSYVVTNSFRLQSLIRNIPNTVFDILTARWNYYIEHHKLCYKNSIILLSAIHLYQYIEKKDCDSLKINWNIVKELETLGYITLEDTYNSIIIRFRHDLIDKFFSKMYSSFSKFIIDYENQQKTCLRNNNLRYYFGTFYSDNQHIEFSSQELLEILDIKIDNRHAYEFYFLVFDRVNIFFDTYYSDNNNICIKLIHKLLICIHDILGNNNMEKCFNTISLKLQKASNIFQNIEYGKLLLYISEALDSMGKYQEAVQLIKKYKTKVFGEEDGNIYTAEQKQLLSEIYNRLHVYCRHQTSFPLDNKEIMGYLDKSSQIAEEISCIAMQYVNFSDKGYLYYDLPISDEEHSKTSFFWGKACEIYEIGGAESKEINYLRKKSQLALLEGEMEKSIQAIEFGLEQVELSTNAYQQTFFKWWFYHALAEGYLLCYKVENTTEIENALERAQFYSELLESNKKFYYLQLKSVYMYYSGKKEEAISLNKEAIDLVTVSNYKIKKRALKKQLLGNELVLLSDNVKTKEHLYSQIHTNDMLFNLPCM